MAKYFQDELLAIFPEFAQIKVITEWPTLCRGLVGGGVMVQPELENRIVRVSE